MTKQSGEQLQISSTRLGVFEAPRSTELYDTMKALSELKLDPEVLSAVRSFFSIGAAALKIISTMWMPEEPGGRTPRQEGCQRMASIT